MRSRSRVRSVGWALALVLLFAGPSLAQAPAAHGDVASLAISQLRSPYCPGLMLEVCPSAQAELLRDSIRALAAQGRTANEIVEWTLARHGEEWRAVPRRSGIGLWAWIVPPAVLLLGAVLLVFWLRSRRRAAPAASVPEGPLSDEDRARVDQALREWEREGAA